MGGKHKVANRTKNNARPASSGRSAELLASSSSQFSLFGSNKDSILALPLKLPDEVDITLDPNIQVVLKKICKKDSVTKIKGLQELAELIKNSEPDAVKPILPMWAKFFSGLATDLDNRVRDATHNTHREVILKAKRNIAPYLKQLMPAWFTSQYDTYPPAASAASVALKEAFPNNKFQEAIIFCQEDILAYISDNLLVQTAHTLSNIKHVSEEEAQAKYERVVISSLQGYCLYLEQVTTEHIQAQAVINNNIISNAKFWEYSKHKVPHIRAAWFKVLIIICQKAQFLLEEKSVQVITTVFGALDEKDSIVVSPVWEALLLTISTIQEWWKYINIEKMFYSKLWKILKQGGDASFSVIYPSLLPLISRLPPLIGDNAAQFYNNFFENCRAGLTKKTSFMVKSESEAKITAFIECFRYVISEKRDDISFCKNLISTQLITTIEWCLTDSQSGYKTIFNQINSLIQSWRRSAESTPLRVYLEFFFESLGNLFEETLFNLKQRDKHDVPSIAGKQVELIISLKHTEKIKKKAKVKFDSEGSHLETHKSNDASLVQSDATYDEKLVILTHRLCSDYVKYIEDNNCQSLIEQLYYLLAQFNPEEFFLKMVEKFKSTNPDCRIIHIYENVLHKWLLSSDLNNHYLGSLIFLLFKYVEESDKSIILNSFSDISNDKCLAWYISEAFSYPYNKEDVVQKWLQSDRVSSFLVSIVDEEINGTGISEWSHLLRRALCENEDGELLVRNSAVQDIIKKLVLALENYQKYTDNLDGFANLSSYILTTVTSNPSLMSYSYDLLTALFRLSCISTIEDDLISSETKYDINSAWQDTLSFLVKNLGKDESLKIASRFAEVVESELFMDDLDEKHIDHIVLVIVKYLRAIYESVPLSLTEYMQLMLDRSSMAMSRSNVHNLCKLSAYVEGSISCPYDPLDFDYKNSLELDAFRVFLWMYLKISVFDTDLEDNNYRDEEEEDENNVDNILKVLDNRALLTAEILHDMSLVNIYLSTFKNTKYYASILTFYAATELKLKSTVSNFDEDLKNELKTVLKEKSLSEAWFWCKAAYQLYDCILPQNLVDVYEEFVDRAMEKNKLGVLHLTQVFSKNLNYDHVHYKFDPVGSIVVLNSLTHCAEIDVQIAEVFSKIEKIRSENVPRFLYDSTNLSWEQAQEIIEVIRLTASLIKLKFTSLTQRHWDFCVICLVSWASNCLKNRASYEKYEFQALIAAVANLYVETDNQIKSMLDRDLKSRYIDEWRDVLVETVHGDLAQIWLYLAEQFEIKKDTLPYLPFIYQISKVIANLKYEFIFRGNDTSMPKWTKFLKRSCSLLLNKQPSLQLWGYKMLVVHIPGLVKIDTEAVSMNLPHKKGLIFEQFKETLIEAHDTVNAMLLDVKFGEDTCQVDPATDFFTYTFACLLFWDVLLTMCQQASSELRYQYAEWLRNDDLLKNFLNIIFRLMPADVLHLSEGKSKSIIEKFQDKPQINITDQCNSELIENLVCWLYYMSLSQLPALVRQWWTSLESRMSQIVEKITILYITQSLCTQELNDVLKYQNNFKNMVIKVMPTAREVIAVYTVDEAQVELVITLPTNYPLGGLDVQCNKQIAGASHKQWLLQFKKCVLHQNGRIWDGLSLWNNNLDKKFDGVEECYICFSVLHPGTCQLPKLSCQTCRKKFHSACLYKWFRTSYKSSCPICRNLF